MNLVYNIPLNILPFGLLDILMFPSFLCEKEGQLFLSYFCGVGIVENYKEKSSIAWGMTCSLSTAQSNHSFIQQWLYSPFVGPWPLLQFRNLFYTDVRTPWTSDQSAARPLPTHRTTQTQNKRTHRHPCLEWNSNLRSQSSSEQREFMRGHCVRLAPSIETEN
jgi:hypothetical protein